MSPESKRSNVRMGSDGKPVYVRSEELEVAAVFERDDGADMSEGTITYVGPDCGEVTVSSGDTILGPDNEEVVTITGWLVTVDPFVAVETYVDLPPEDGGGVPNSPHAFTMRFLGYEDNDGFNYQIGESVAASGDELEREKWADTIDVLRSLEEGDTVLWGERTEPLTVQWSVTLIEDVRLEGPRGGQYTIEFRDGTPPTIRRGGSHGASLGPPEGFRVVDRADVESGEGQSD